MYWPTLGVRAAARAGACFALAAGCSRTRRTGLDGALGAGASASDRENMFSMRTSRTNGSDVLEEASAVPPGSAAKDLNLQHLSGEIGRTPGAARQFLPINRRRSGCHQPK